MFGVIADDVTGGTDLAGAIRRTGLDVIQTFGVPDTPVPASDVLIVSLKTRTAPVPVATAEAIRAAVSLEAAGASHLFFKYCSTFDSTPAGNIGPVMDVLLDHVGASFAVACPAYPSLGRTVYLGHLFVDSQLLSESSMRHHPLTPMNDANLVRLLGAQSRGSVGLVPLVEVEAGSGSTRSRLDRLAADGCRLAIVDAVFDRHVETIARAVADRPLASGGAALGAALAREVARAGSGVATRPRVQPRTPKDAAHDADEPVAVLCGSCSLTTREQVRQAAAAMPAEVVDPVKLAADARELPRLLDWARRHARRGPLMVSSTTAPDGLAAVHARLGRQGAAALVESAFEQLATTLAEAGVRSFVVAGGETSGAVMSALGIKAINVLDEIEPGVPWTSSLVPAGFRFVLKSGNFGSPSFLLRALGRIRD